jgi:diacylglycerol kinase
MELSDKLLLELAASLAAITTVWIYGNRSRNAPIIGILGLVLWWWLTISQEMWGLIPLNVVMLFVHIRNYIRMRREDNIRNQL